MITCDKCGKAADRRAGFTVCTGRDLRIDDRRAFTLFDTCAACTVEAEEVMSRFFDSPIQISKIIGEKH